MEPKFKCSVCKRWQYYSDIEVISLKTDNLTRNIRYCAANMDCKQKAHQQAEEWELKMMDFKGKELKDGNP